MVLGQVIMWRELCRDLYEIYFFWDGIVMGEIMRKAVIMCMQMRHIEVSPARYQLIGEMAERGIEIFLCLYGDLSMEAKKTCKGITHFLNAESLSKRNIRKQIVKYEPNIVIAFTYEDTEILYLLPKRLKETKFYYFNLEINTLDYYLQSCGRNTWKYWIKKLKYPFSVLKEVFYTKQCECLVIQDEERKRVARKYHLKHEKTMLIPNSYIYDEKVKCSAERKEIIYSGGIRKKYLVSYWKDFYDIKTVDILFCGTFDEWGKRELIKIHRVNPNIKMKGQTLTADAYTRYMQKYAVGLVCYSKGSDDNLNYIGLSSGKFFKHLSIGQPVIVLGYSKMSREVEKYGLGVAVDSVFEIESAYNKIMERYDYYCDNVRLTYQQKYDFRKIIQPFLAKMDKDTNEFIFVQKEKV